MEESSYLGSNSGPLQVPIRSEVLPHSRAGERGTQQSTEAVQRRSDTAGPLRICRVDACGAYCVRAAPDAALRSRAALRDEAGNGLSAEGEACCRAARCHHVASILRTPEAEEGLFGSHRTQRELGVRRAREDMHRPTWDSAFTIGIVSTAAEL